MSDMMAMRITVEWGDGDVGRFERQPDGSWVQHIAGLAVTDYDGPNVLRVLATAVGTKEIAE